MLRTSSNTFAYVLAKCMEEAAKTNAAKPGDYYGEDGFLRCGKCGGKKMHMISIPNLNVFDQIVYCSCYCRQAELKNEEARRKQKAHAEYVAELNRECFLSPRMMAMTFKNSDNHEGVALACEQYCETYQSHRGDGYGLLLFGEPGTGKTYLAAATCNALMNQGVSCKMITFTDLANELYNAQNKLDVYLKLDKYEMLVVDDLGVERETEFMAEVMETVIDRRYRMKYPIIVTTNYTAEEMKHPTTLTRKRIFSRLEAMTVPLEMEGGDRRRR